MIVKTSLQRFLDTRGAELLGNAPSRRISRMQCALGAMLSYAGLMILFCFWPQHSLASFLACGVLIAGGIAGIAFVIQHESRSIATPSEPTMVLTSDAKRLLRILMKTRPSGKSSRLAVGRSKTGALKTQCRGSQTLPTDILDLLEEATAEYHAILGTVKLRQSSSQALCRSSQRIRSAADETLAQLLHNAAVLVDFPESSLTSRDVMSVQLGSLYELARHVDVIASSEPSFADRLTAQSLMDVVLEEMRMDERTRSELNR